MKQGERTENSFIHELKNQCNMCAVLILLRKYLTNRADHDLDNLDPSMCIPGIEGRGVKHQSPATTTLMSSTTMLAFRFRPVGYRNVRQRLQLWKLLGLPILAPVTSQEPKPFAR